MDDGRLLDAGERRREKVIEGGRCDEIHAVPGSRRRPWKAGDTGRHTHLDKGEEEKVLECLPPRAPPGGPHSVQYHVREGHGRWRCGEMR